MGVGEDGEDIGLYDSPGYASSDIGGTAAGTTYEQYIAYQRTSAANLVDRCSPRA